MKSAASFLVFATCAFWCLLEVSYAAQNCPKCGSVNACLAECNRVDPYFLTGTWSQCKTRCQRKGKCAIRTMQRCMCAEGCDNIQGNDANPFAGIDDGIEDIDYEAYVKSLEDGNPADHNLWYEAFGVGAIVSSALFVIISVVVALITYSFVCARPVSRAQKAARYEKVALVSHDEM